MTEARWAKPTFEDHSLEFAPKWEVPGYKAARKLEGKRCLVTGGDAGIGRAVAWLFAREGADVAITHLPEQRDDARQMVAWIERRGRRAFAFEVDLRDPDQARATVDRASEALGGLDILVNNALETNLQACTVVAEAALRHLSKGGLIVNTGLSITGLEREQGLPDNPAMEGPVQAFTKSLAYELVPRGVRVNCVALGSICPPEEIAPAYVFLANAIDSNYITGEVFTHRGGSLAPSSRAPL